MLDLQAMTKQSEKLRCDSICHATGMKPSCVEAIKEKNPNISDLEAEKACAGSGSWYDSYISSAKINLCYFYRNYVNYCDKDYGSGGLWFVYKRIFSPQNVRLLGSDEKEICICCRDSRVAILVSLFWILLILIF